MEKRTTIFKALVALLVIMLGVNFDAGAQSLINLAARGINKAKANKEAKKEAALAELSLPQVDKKGKPITFKWENTAIGTWNPSTFEIAFNQKYDEGSMKGQQVIYKVDPTTGNVTNNAGAAKGYMREGGEMESPNLGKLQVKKDGGKTSVYRNGKVIGYVNTQKAWADAKSNIGSFVDDVPVMLVAYVYFGCLTSEFQTIKWAGEPIIPQPINDAPEVTFKWGDKKLGTWNPQTLKFTYEYKHSDGPNAGKNIIYTVNPKTGKVTDEVGNEMGSMNNDGTITASDGLKFKLSKANNGTYNISYNNSTVGNIINNSSIYCYGKRLGDIDEYVSPLFFAFLYYGTIVTEDDMVQWKAEHEEAVEKARIEAERRAKEEAERIAKEKEKLIEVYKNGRHVGYVDGFGNVYDHMKSKIGKLPEGNGNIVDERGWTKGKIWSSQIENSSGKFLCKVWSNDIEILDPRQNCSNCYVKGATISFGSDINRYDWEKGYSTSDRIGSTKDSIKNNIWLAALIYCDFFF